MVLPLLDGIWTGTHRPIHESKQGPDLLFQLHTSTEHIDLCQTFPIICQTSPLSEPVIETSFKNPILHIVHLKQTSRNTPNNKISLDSPYLSDRFSQMNINNPVLLSASSMNSIKAKFMKDIPKPIPNISKE